MREKPSKYRVKGPTIPASIDGERRQKEQEEIFLSGKLLRLVEGLKIAPQTARQENLQGPIAGGWASRRIESKL